MAAGLLTPAQLRSAAWRRVFRDVYVATGSELDDRARLAALRLVLPPDAVARGRTAAWLYGAWRPVPGRDVPLELARGRGAHGRGRADASMRRLVTRPDTHPLLQDVVVLEGVRALSAHRACFELMRQRSLVEAVVVADAFAWAGALHLGALGAYVDTHHRWPGVRNTRVALELASARAASPGETRLRLVVVLVGFPEPLVNVRVYRDDELVGIPDLLVRGRSWVGLEYQGAYHWELDGQPQRDDVRANRFATESSIPLLRYHDAAVRWGRDRVVQQVAQLSGASPRRALEDSDFARPRPQLAW